MKMKAVLLGAVMAIGVPASAHAQGILVHDNASTIQLIAQVKNTLQQIQQGEQIISQATATYNSLSKLTNTANFASILNNPNVSQLLPNGVTDIVKLAQSDASGLGNFGSGAQALSGQFTINGILGNGVTLNSSASTAYGQYLTSINQGPSKYAELGYNVSNQATSVDSGLDELRSDIGSAKDPKDSMDLNTRATIESAKVNNRMLQLMGMQQYYNASERMRYNAYRLSRLAAEKASVDALVRAQASTSPGY
jgi:type IV secretion system protein VirB5